MFRQLFDEVLDKRSLQILDIPPSRQGRWKRLRSHLGLCFVDITVTATEVELVSGNAASYTAGETITAGMPLYLSSWTDNRVYKADNNTGDSRKVELVGIALHAATAGQPIIVQTSGVIDIGATLTLGETYVVSATAGGIAPIADLSSSYVSHIGIATDTTNKYITLNFFSPGSLKT